MRQISLFCVFLAVACVVSGCGGSSGGGSSSNPFAGKYVGTLGAGGGEVDSLYLVVSSNGTVTGSEINTTTDAAAAVTGTVTSGGVLTFDVSGDGSPFTGTVTLNSSGDLDGSLTSGGTSYPITTTPSTSSNTSPYTGTIAGTFVASNSDTGNFTAVVDATGQVSGVIADITSNTVVTVTGTITNTGQINLTASGGGGTYTGTFTLNSATTISGSIVSSQSSHTLTVTATLSS